MVRSEAHFFIFVRVCEVMVTYSKTVDSKDRSKDWAAFWGV